MKRPELLIPAGNLEKLKVACLYGADAVYLGGKNFGLRAASDNFTSDELVQAVGFAHARGVKVYVVLNAFSHDEDLTELPRFVQFLEEIKADAVIVSDLGVMQTVKACSSLDLHISTQASCLNVGAAQFWKANGAKRVILGREVSIPEAGLIKQQTGLEIEMFVHGSLCMAYSGNCTISNYTQGRDSNRGGCAHSCRFEYSLEFEGSDQKAQSYFMSSKDLAGIEQIPLFFEHGIDSLKIEGRMKSHLYVGTVAKVYQQAIDTYQTCGQFDGVQIQKMQDELLSIPHREYTSAALLGPAGEASIDNQREGAVGPEHGMIGVVLEACPNRGIVLQVKRAFNAGDPIEVVPFKSSVQRLDSQAVRNINGEMVERTKPGTVVQMPYVLGAERFNFVRERGQHV